MSNNTKEKPRTGIRFTSTDGEFGFISFNSEKFKPDSAVFIINESAHGACLVLNRKLVPPQISFKEGLNIMIKVGKLDPVPTIIRWVQFIDEDIIKFGVENTEKRLSIKFD